MTQIQSAAPKVVPLGIQDVSGRSKAVGLEAIPTHLPKVFLFAKKGPTSPQLVGEGAAQMYGADTFDLRKPYATHQTAVAKAAAAAGNAQMIVRLTPADAKLKSNFTLYLDVLETTVQQYQRNADGSFTLDGVTGLPVAVTGGGATLPGFKAKWVLESKTTGLATDADSVHFGNKVQKPGTLGTAQDPSTMYPVLEFWASSFGAYGNDCGMRLWAPKLSDNSPVNSTLMGKVKAYPFRLAAIRRTDANSTAKLVPTLSGDMTLDFVVPTGTIDPSTDGDVSLLSQLKTAWQQLGAPGYDDVFADMGGWHLYESNIATLVADFYAAEKAHLPAVTDFSSTATNEQWMFNFVSGVSTSGAPYNTFALDATSLKLTENTNLWAAGGTDGTMSNATLATLVSDYMDGYADRNSELMNSALHVESIIYDSGFPLQTKKDLCKFIAIRKDTFVVLSTYEVGGAEMSHAAEAATATALRAALELYPESTYFGTSIVRGMVIGFYGDWLAYGYGNKLPLTLELVTKAGRLMGAGDGVWKAKYLFDRSPENQVENFSNVNVTFVPADQRNKDWANGLNYPQQFDRKKLFMPAFKTAYSDDTSVLTSFLTAMVCVEAQKVGERVWREFSGVISLTEAQLIDKVNKRTAELMPASKFANLFVIVPETTITASDAQSGYRWTTAIKVYANNMKTVMSLSVQALRMSDLAS